MKNPSLSYSSLGEGLPLLILHGLFGSSRNWQSLSKQYSQYFKVITIDLRNHGDSFHDSAMNYTLMAADVEQLMDQLELSSAHVLGHSMGGKVAMKFCQLHPGRVDKLVVADIAPVSYQHDYGDILYPVLNMDLSRVTNRKDGDVQLAHFITDQRVRLFILQNLVFYEGRAAWKLNWSAIEQNIMRITGYENIDNWQINNTSLFIRGDMSDYLNDENWGLIQQHFSRSRLVGIKKAGHWLHAEQPDDFYDATLKFLLR